MARKKNERQLAESDGQPNDTTQPPVPAVQNSATELALEKSSSVTDKGFRQETREEVQYSLYYIMKSWLPIGSGPFLLLVVTIANVFIVSISSVITLDKAFLVIIFLVIATYNGVKGRELPKVEKFLEAVRSFTSKDKSH